MQGDGLSRMALSGLGPQWFGPSAVGVFSG